MSVGRLSADLRLPLGAAVAVPDGLVTFPQLDIQVPGWAAGRLLRGYRRLVDLKSNFTNTFAVQITGDEVRLTAAGITLLVRTWGDVDVMHEILVRELYHFDLGQPCAVWDVGMNVGMASLYFAAMPEVTAVHGYELFRPTCEQARSNFALNPTLAPKIKSYAYGLGATTQALDLPYHEDLKGVVGLQGPLVSHPGINLRREPVEVMPATEALARIRSSHPTLPVVLKMDCEGAEGEIFESLVVAGMMGDVALIMMEWHGTGMRLRLEKLLRDHGFVSISQPFPGADVGSLTAFRSAAPATN